MQFFTGGEGTFSNQTISGDWTLRVIDDQTGNAGQVTGFEIYFNQ